MPELPEVETMRRDLADALAGATVTSVRLHHDDILLDRGSPARFTAGLAGRPILAVERRGKNLLFRLAPEASIPDPTDRPAVLQAQVRMTGRFAIADAADPGGSRLREELGLSHVAAEFGLADGRFVLYDDVRRLGGFRLLTAAEWAVREADLGPEPLADDFTASRLADRLGRGRSPVKNALLDQRRLVGVGNIYASEALCRARIDPRRTCGDLSHDDVRRLHRAVRSVLREALRGEGTSLRDYRAVDGRTGRFQERLRVYDREGESCRVCTAPIRRIVQAGRSTFFCPACQA